MTVVIVGGGPAGLAAATELRRLDTRDVVVVEREAEPGGLPRHERHRGFGIRDLRRALSGAAYAGRHARLATEAGAEIRTDTTVSGWSPEGPLELTGPRGRETIAADAVILAVGCREQAGSARVTSAGSWVAAVRRRTPLWARTAVPFTAGWAPDHEPALAGGLEMDSGTRGPVVDAALRTSRDGVFAAGNAVHAAEPSDVAALSGRHAAATAAEYVRGSAWPAERVSIRCEQPLQWIAPNALSAVARPGAKPPRGRFLLRSLEFVSGPRIEIAQDGRILWDGRLRRLVPGRSTSLPAGWTAGVEAGGGPVRVRVVRRG
jgi:NADPH-dependent 2,4-dienoyl-CoA reductase/sulfur reductase-like enzyme